MNKNLIIIGHRGNQGYATENSYDAIMNCSISDNIDGTEFDIRPTKDNKIVIMHNSKIDGITKSKGRIQDLTFEQLLQFQFKTKFVDQFLQRIFNLISKDSYFYKQYCLLGKKSSNIVLFDTIMKEYSKEKHMLIELKGCINEYLESKQQIFENNVIETLIAYDYKNRNLALEGYNYDLLYKIKSKLPDIKIVALINKKKDLNLLDMGFDGVSLEYNLINEEVIEKVIRNNMTLYSWDDKKPVLHYNFINSIVSKYSNEIETGNLRLYVITDFPEKAKEYIKVQKKH